MTELTWTERLRTGFRRTSDRFGDNITGLFGKAALDDASLDELEEGLIASDLGPRPPPRSASGSPASASSAA
jgi:fused signal recognition particle receptor